MNEPTKVIELENRRVEIYHDEDPVDPREWDNIGTMVCFHSNYILGDKHDYKTNQQWAIAMLETIIEPYHDQISGWYTNELWSYAHYNNLPDEVIKPIWDKISTKYIVLPLYLYDHSGITMNTVGFSCPWDSGQVGYIYVSKNQVREEYGWKNLTKKRIAKIEKYLCSEVEIYDYFIMGRAYGYHLICNLCNEHIDSCWGFYGEDWKENGLMEYAEQDFKCVCQKAEVYQNAGMGL